MMALEYRMQRRLLDEEEQVILDRERGERSLSAPQGSRAGD
jgi:hypothetical protein